MKFKITATSIWNDEEIIEKYPCLMKFGYEVLTEYVPITHKIRDEGGFLIDYINGTRAVNTPIVHIKTLEDIMGLINMLTLTNECHTSVIISNDRDIPKIEIYDTYRE